MVAIYDTTGYIYFCGDVSKTPEGIPYMDIDVPEGKILMSINTGVEPHQPVYADVPKSEIQLLKEQVQQLQAQSDILAAQNEALIDGINAMTGAAEIEENGGVGV